MSRSGIALSAILLAMSACDGCRDEEASSETPAAVVEPAPANAATPVATGIVEGRVVIAEGAELPSYPIEMMPAATATDVPVEDCSPPKTTDRQPVTLGADGRGLMGALVAAANFRATPASTPRVRDVVIRDCRLSPMFVDATLGDTLRIKNEGTYPHVPVIPGVGAVQQAIVPGSTVEHVLSEAGLKTIGCGAFGANCGRLDYIVMLHPVHTTSGAEGRFRLENVPANEDVTINAWHPLFRAAEARVRVSPGETRTVELVLIPDPPRVTQPPPVPPHKLRPGEEFLD